MTFATFCLKFHTKPCLQSFGIGKIIKAKNENLNFKRLNEKIRFKQIVNWGVVSIGK